MKKRIFDLLFSFFGLLFLSLPFLLISFFIKLESKGPVFFRQWRVGKDGKRFRIFKFRTMRNTEGLQVTIKDDVRITRVGRVLRRYKLDELPQLMNVLRGEMSLVGPRPEVPRYVERYTAEQRKVLQVKPGITDLASLQYLNESEMLNNDEDVETEYLLTVMPEKLKLNLRYIEQSSLWGDCKLIWRTIFRVLFNEGETLFV